MAYSKKSYSFEKPGLVSKMGSRLDTSLSFVNYHQYSLMQTKNKVIDFVQGTFHLNAETAYSIIDKMDEPVKDKIKHEQLPDVFHRFKIRNEKFTKRVGFNSQFYLPAILPAFVLSSNW